MRGKQDNVERVGEGAMLPRIYIRMDALLCAIRKLEDALRECGGQNGVDEGVRSEAYLVLRKEASVTCTGGKIVLNRKFGLLEDYKLIGMAVEKRMVMGVFTL
jgi:hypothetical protein